MGKEMEKKTGQFNPGKLATRDAERTEKAGRRIRSKLALYQIPSFLCGSVADF
jgi:hypothetical protein